MCLLRYQQVVFPLCTEIQLGVIAQFGFKPDGEGIIQFTQVLILTLEEQTDIFTQSERLSLSHIVSSIHQRQMGKRLPCPFLATSPKCTPYAADLMFCSAHQADGERGPGGGQVSSACQELLHPSGKAFS